MSERLEQSLSESTSSAADSPVRTSAAPAPRLVSMASSPVFGSRCLDSFASYDPDTSLWRTSQISFLGGLAAFSEIWPRAGMTRSGTAYKLRPLAPRMAVTVSGSSLIPTPTKGDAKSAANATARRFRVPPTGVHAGTTLTDYVRMYPTPMARTKGGRGGGRGKGSISRGGGLMLDNVLGGKPNPTFVEWLMGYPLGWTTLDSPLSATPSSHSSPSGSDTGSSKRKRQQ